MVLALGRDAAAGCAFTQAELDAFEVEAERDVEALREEIAERRRSFDAPPAWRVRSASRMGYDWSWNEHACWKAFLPVVR